MRLFQNNVFFKCKIFMFVLDLVEYKNLEVNVSIIVCLAIVLAVVVISPI